MATCRDRSTTTHHAPADADDPSGCLASTLADAASPAASEFQRTLAPGTETALHESRARVDI